MNRRTWSVACLTTLILAATAWSESTSEDTTAAPASSDESVTALDTTGTDGPLQSIKDQVRSEFAQLIVDEIHSFFQSIRTSLGLPAESTDPATDPLAILETVITDMVENKLTS